ncbi:MAG: ribonuclease HII [Candidatus Diapherotrites archaeon]|nr:ribonuclease HII [Candidatus Diapherotrites archaeon]
MLIAGIDEAGRGPCIGPLVMAVTSIKKENEHELTEIGVTDSKLIPKEKRETLYKKIKKLVVEHKSTKITAEQIDELRTYKSLNEIEAMGAAKILNALKTKPDVVYIDSPDTKMEAFGKRIEKYISFKTRIISEHKADLNYPVASAASIIAKVERDDAIKELAKEYGEMGSGYPGDENTIKFLRKYFLEHSKMPNFARKSWQTIANLENERFQKKLF